MLNNFNLRVLKLALALQKKAIFITCFLLFKARPNKNKNRNILLLRTSALGDFLFAVPSMNAIRQCFPSAKIALLTATTTNTVHSKKIAESYVGGYAALPWVKFVVPSIIDEVIYFSALNLRKLFSDIRPQVLRFNPNIVFILAHPGESGFSLFKKIVFLKLVGVQCVVYGWRAKANNSFLRETQYAAGLFEHHVIGALRSVTECPLVPHVEDIAIEFPLSHDVEDIRWGEDLWKKNGWHSVSVIAVAPGSIQLHKRWPAEKFIDLCQQLAARKQVAIVVIGTKDDKVLGERIRLAIPEAVINLAGQTTIPQAAVLLARCELLVGNDGGAMHLGAAVGCRVVSIVPGIEYPNSIEPWGNIDLAVRHPVPCAPCYSFSHCPRGDNRCMNEIVTQSVLAQCVKVLDEAEVLNRDLS